MSLATSLPRFTSILALLTLGLAPRAWAVDGVLEINQTCAVDTGCFAGDVKGFPVKITSNGSYRLTGNLTLPNNNTTGISIEATDVTLDLNGFEIICFTCVTQGSGNGIDSAVSSSSVKVTNGTVHAVGNIGIRIIGNNAHLENVRVITSQGIGVLLGDDCFVKGSVIFFSGGDGLRAGERCLVRENLLNLNDGDGIDVWLSSTIEGNTVSNNGGFGILCNNGNCTIQNNVSVNNLNKGIVTVNSAVSGNTVNGNQGEGIDCVGCTVTHNVAVNNSGVGLLCPGTISCGYGNNHLHGNNGGNANPQASGGIEIGTNVCGGNTTCP